MVTDGDAQTTTVASTHGETIPGREWKAESFLQDSRVVTLVHTPVATDRISAPLPAQANSNDAQAVTDPISVQVQVNSNDPQAVDEAAVTDPISAQAINNEPHDVDDEVAVTDPIPADSNDSHEQEDDNVPYGDVKPEVLLAAHVQLPVDFVEMMPSDEHKAIAAQVRAAPLVPVMPNTPPLGDQYLDNSLLVSDPPLKNSENSFMTSYTMSRGQLSAAIVVIVAVFVTFRTLLVSFCNYDPEPFPLEGSDLGWFYFTTLGLMGLYHLCNIIYREPWVIFNLQLVHFDHTTNFSVVCLLWGTLGFLVFIARDLWCHGVVRNDTPIVIVGLLLTAYVPIAGMDLLIFQIVPCSVSVCNILPHCIALHPERDDSKVVASLQFLFQLLLSVSALRAGAQWVVGAIYVIVLWAAWGNFKRVVL